MLHESHSPEMLRMVKESTQPHHKRSRLHVLVVEDHSDTAKAMEKLLALHGFSVRAVGSYRKALSMATEWTPDVLISDIVLPGKDGIELMQTMRLAHPRLCGIVVSGHADKQLIHRSREAGFSDYLVKPVEIDLLVHAIRRLFVQRN
jgi:two-component system CheB/CheR fusion protein